MALGSNDVLRLDFTTRVAMQQQRCVLVISDRREDALLASKLLSRAGYSSDCSVDITAISAAPPFHEFASRRYAATVIFHRASEYQERDLPRLTLLPGQRIIAISDCEAERTIVSLLDRGAHHVFCLPESDSLLQVRLEAALRQHSTLASESFSLGDIHFDVPKRRVTRGGRCVDLSPKEYDLAYYLFSNRDRVVCNSELMTSIWSLPATMDTRRIDTAACRLRKKMKLSADHGWELKRLRRVGYQLIPVTVNEPQTTQPEMFDRPFQAVAG